MKYTIDSLLLADSHYPHPVHSYPYHLNHGFDRSAACSQQLLTSTSTWIGKEQVASSHTRTVKCTTILCIHLLKLVMRISRWDIWKRTASIETRQTVGSSRQRSRKSTFLICVKKDHYFPIYNSIRFTYSAQKTTPSVNTTCLISSRRLFLHSFCHLFLLRHVFLVYMYIYVSVHNQMTFNLESDFLLVQTRIRHWTYVKSGKYRIFLRT